MAAKCRAAIYVREDPARDAQTRLDAQVAELTAFVRRRGGRFVGTYWDLCPGTTLERRGLAKLVAHARARRFDVVVVEYRETVAPDPGARRMVRDKLGTAGVRVVVLRPPAGARLGLLVAGLALVDLVEGL